MNAPSFGARATVVVNMETTVLTDVPCAVDGEPIPYRRALSAVTRGRPPMFCSDGCMHQWNTQMYRRTNDITAAFTSAYEAAHGATPSAKVIKDERALAIELLKAHDAHDIIAAITVARDRLGSKFSSLADLERVAQRKQKKRSRNAS